MAERHDLDQTQSTRRAFAVTPNDSVNLDIHTRGLYIGTAGTIRVTHVEDTSPTDYPTTVAGSVYPWAVKKVHATGTTASNIIAQV
jgi:hypothetical protein